METIKEIRFVLGNEAMARGAMEAGVGFVAGYPGTPSSEVLQTLAKSADDPGIWVEWSVNEMVAFEKAMGASMAGKRALVTMKHAGFNWIADPLSVAALSGVNAGLVILTADDPGCHSSANEQDNRFYGLLFSLPVLEPFDPASARDMMKAAFDLSEKSRMPVILRSVTRLGHSRAGVAFSPITANPSPAAFTRDPERFFVTGKRAVARRRWQAGQKPALTALSDEFAFNRLAGRQAGEDLVVVSGVAAGYVEEAFERNGWPETPLLYLAMVHPLPARLVKKALAGKKRVMVIEEGGPFVEQGLKALALDSGCRIRISGRQSGHLPEFGELTLEKVEKGLAAWAGRPKKSPPQNHGLEKKAAALLPPRTMVFCAGCPHTGTMAALKWAMKKAKISPLVAGDIGCYTLMCYPPHELGDVKFSMGASIGAASGLNAALREKTVAVIGDSTFIHAGIPGLINCVYNESDILVIIADNRTTAMTGAQPHAGVGMSATGKKAPALCLEDLVKGCGVDFLEVTDPYQVKQTRKVFQKALAHKGVSVVISRRACALLAARTKDPDEFSPYAVDPETCVGCFQCISKTACPALLRKDKKTQIQEALCAGCGICAGICPSKAISRPGDLKKNREQATGQGG